MDGRREERRERPLEFTWSDLKAGIILFSPSSSILSLLTIIYLLLRASLDSFISYNPPFSLSFSPPHRVKRKEFIFCHVFLRINHTYKGYNERKSEKKSGGDFFSSIFLYSGPIRISAFVTIKDSINFTSFDIYLFLTYLHMIGAVCVMIKHCFSIVYCHSHRDTFSSNGILISRYTALRSVESVSSLKTQRAFN